ncbi:integrin-alpha FG-GAP repeat-containing protein 2 [Striga asiatica]|uniref:Integrin-alpha FG-GAP repeat-containing protein 2 n=1 Tax=Striga asiatica TaxID=4170 RepID=A0A5A7QJZ4_STRAF|nr:integrin-alpha FG-GAP repeat-containing protein 2 [Striga asiatica]
MIIGYGYRGMSLYEIHNLAANPSILEGLVSNPAFVVEFQLHFEQLKEGHLLLPSCFSSSTIGATYVSLWPHSAGPSSKDSSKSKMQSSRSSSSGSFDRLDSSSGDWSLSSVSESLFFSEGPSPDIFSFEIRA